MYLHVGVIFLFSVLIECQRLLKGPEDTAVLEGSWTRLTCSVDLGNDYLEWIEYITDPGGRRIFLSFTNNANRYIEDKHPRKERYMIEGTFNLVVKNVTREDAGRYRCRLVLSDEFREADIIVVERPQCTQDGVIQEGDIATLGCETKYYTSARSRRIPQLRWFSGTNRLSGSIVFGDHFVRHQVNFMPNSTDNGRSYTCRAFFEPSPPDFSDSCKLVLKVFYAPTDIEIIPKIKVFAPDDVIQCLATGHPSPSYRWVRLRGYGPSKIEGPIIHVSRHMYGSHTYRCIVENPIGVLDTTIDFEVKGPGYNSKRADSRRFWKNKAHKTNSTRWIILLALCLSQLRS